MAIHAKGAHSQRFFLFGFRCIVRLDTFRFYHPVAFSVCSSVIVFLLMLWVSDRIPFDQIPDLWTPPIKALACGNVTRWLISLSFGLIITQPLSRQLLPLLFYVPQAVAMKNLGLLYVTTDQSEKMAVMKKCAAEHVKGKKVRVVCISGRFLFREESMPTGDICPLHALAESGDLDVIMPLSDPKNPTLLQRYSTYSDKFKAANGISTIEQFIHFEVDSGKDFLRGFNCKVTEHSILCVWRLIIFSEHSVVQNYFPNLSQSESFRAPMFVYARRVDGTEPHSYYEMHSIMFDMIKRGC